VKDKIIALNEIDAFVFDFDGVLTNNIVHIDQYGNELVSCSRSDGIAFDVLRKLGKPSYILSTEKNPVVTARANKLGIKALQGVENKTLALLRLVNEHKYHIGRVLYVGNDINDYHVMQSCGFTACPIDSHEKIKEISGIVLKALGGHGVVRELLEDVFNIDFISVLYGK
jgi:3-deoxy-D-manno-octulosonate 8-phosphate phosphatase (KDO 8-P phosphatase)